uniref:C-type lectin domain-containing protein n=1 Tax=Pelusios castaneus TaxID=367368 RepID=A0A8C8RHZ1_9SAUR
FAVHRLTWLSLWEESGPLYFRLTGVFSQPEFEFPELMTRLFPSLPPEGAGCKLCPRDWQPHGDKCYWLSKERKVWTRSRDDCSRRNSRMLVIQNREEMGSLVCSPSPVGLYATCLYLLCLISAFPQLNQIPQWAVFSPSRSLVMSTDFRTSTHRCSSLEI